MKKLPSSSPLFLVRDVIWVMATAMLKAPHAREAHMAGPTQKLAKDIEGDTQEQVAWGLLEWIRLVEDVRDRRGILDAYRDGLIAVREGTLTQLQVPDALASSGAANGTQRRLAYKLAHLVAETEGRDPGQRNQGDRAWILETYSECLEAVMGRRQLAAVATAADAAGATGAAVAGEAVAAA